MEKGIDTINGTINGTINSNDTINDTINLKSKSIKLSNIEAHVLKILAIDNSSTRITLTEKIGCSEPTIGRTLDSLVKKGLIKREGSRKSGRWIILK